MSIRLSRQLLSNLFDRKSMQVLILVSIISLGAFTALTYQNFLYLQSQNISQLSLYNEVVKPLVGLALMFQILLMGMACSLTTPYFKSKGQVGMVVHSPINDLKLFIKLYLTVLTFGFIPLINYLLIAIFYYCFSEIDFALIVSSSSALIASLLLYSALIITIALFVKNNILALLLSLTGVFIFIVLDELLRVNVGLNSYALALDLIFQLRAGLIVPAAISSWLLWWVLFLVCGVFSLKYMRLRRTRRQTMLVAIMALVVILNGRFIPTALFSPIDVSAEHLNSLQPVNAQIVSEIEQPIKITAVIDDESKHDEIRQATNILQQYKSDIELEFTNRQALGAKSEFVDQFVTVEIGDLQQSLRFPFDRSAKQALSELVVQLSTRANQWVLFVEGHGEASPFGQTNRALSSFYQSLKQLGWPVAMQNFSKQSSLSENTKVLVVAASQQQWLPNEVKLLLEYLAGGGNLLLLREGNDQIPLAVNQYLGIDLIKGTLIDWQGYQSGTPHPAIVIVNEFEQHPINTGIDSLLAFPWSHGLLVPPQQSSARFEIQPVLKTHSGVWTEFNPDQEQLAFNSELGELKQSFPLAVALKNKNSQQRVVVVGDSSFLSDSAINNYNNRQFALNLISWLSSQTISKSTNGYLDNHIKTNPVVHWILLWGFSVVLPFLVAVVLLFLRHKRTPNLNSESR